MGDEQIGSRLALSVRTVERHLSNVYVKLSVSGKSARAAAVGRLRELEDGSVWR
jgi:DNA-binding NarL/FixJ family response regulator